MTDQIELIPRILDSKVLESYREAIKIYGEKAQSSLNVFQDRSGVLTGSNCFAPIVLRDLLPKSSRLATMADLGLATEIDPQFLFGFFLDTGLVLRTEGDYYKPNDSLAKDLAKQLNKRRIDLKHPKVIYFDALDLRQNKNSTYGLSYVLNERAKIGENIIDAPKFARNFNFRTIDERGIPIEDSNGSRHLYTKKNRLSRFFLGRVLDLDSSWEDLAYSDGNGRVVIIDAEGIAKNF